MGRPKGSRNKPKPLHPSVQAAVAFAQANGFAYTPAPPAAPARKIPEDFRDFLPLIKIRSKDNGRLITPVLFEEQLELLDAWENGEDLQPHILVLKARKIGVTTFFALLFLHQWLIAPDPIMVVHLANNQKTANEIMTMIKTAIASLPEDLRPTLTTNQARKIARESPGSPGVDGATIIVETARGDRALAGFTPHLLHIAEANFCRNPEELRASAFAAVPIEAGGRIVLESTASHVDDILHQEFKKAEAGIAEVPWTTFFFPWTKHAAYVGKVVGDFVLTPEEEKLAEEHDLTNEQLAWRRRMIATVGDRRFPREFPATIADAYSNLEGQWIQTSGLVDQLRVVDIKDEGRIILREWEAREAYCAAIDAAAGVGGDATSCVILNARTLLPAAVYRSTTVAPEEGSNEIWHLLLMYGSPMVLVEWNSYGIPYYHNLQALRANLYSERTHEFDGQRPVGDEHPFVTNERTRIEVLEAFRQHVLTGAISEVDSICYSEMQQARVDKNGKIVFPRSKKNGHGDVLMAYALALRCRRHVRIPDPPPPPSILRERELRRQRTGALVAPGARY